MHELPSCLFGSGGYLRRVNISCDVSFSGIMRYAEGLILFFFWGEGVFFSSRMKYFDSNLSPEEQLRGGRGRQCSLALYLLGRLNSLVLEPARCLSLCSSSCTQPGRLSYHYCMH